MHRRVVSNKLLSIGLYAHRGPDSNGRSHESSLREKLEVSSHGRRVPVEVTDTHLADEDLFRVVLCSAEDLDFIDVRLHAGLKPAQGDAGAMGVGEPADVPKLPGHPLVAIRGP